MTIIVDYEAGNLRSVQRACHAVGMDAHISADPEQVRRAERIIFPGVGTAVSAVATLAARSLDTALREAFACGTPMLGICIGAQIVLEHTEEGGHDCLGLIAGKVRRFRPDNPALKVPHIGWNAVRPIRTHPLLNGLDDGDQFYFVHAYFPEPADPDHVFAMTDYDHEFCSILGHANLFATQFHLEKSGRFGLRLLERFRDWDGSTN